MLRSGSRGRWSRWCEPKRPQLAQGRLGEHPPHGLDSTVGARVDGGQDGPIHIHPARDASPPALLRSLPHGTMAQTTLTSHRLLNPRRNSHCQHGRRNEHCVDYRTPWQPSLPAQARRWPIASARRIRFGRAACLQDKTIKLEQHYNVFSMLAYWNLAHLRMEKVAHLPRSQTLPDLNRLGCILPNGRSSGGG